MPPASCGALGTDPDRSNAGTSEPGRQLMKRVPSAVIDKYHAGRAQGTTVHRPRIRLPVFGS